MLLLQRVPAAEVTAFELLQAFSKEMTYAAAFPCICCGLLHFSSNVVLAKNVEALSTLDGLGWFCLEENWFKDIGSLGHWFPRTLVP